MKVVVVCGATATGKTDFALKLAHKYHTEIINFDSQQVYQDFDIGTAKPSKAELELVRHHLIGEISPREKFNAGDFRKRCLEILSSMEHKGFKAAVLVGGTGFYLNALLNGMFESPPSDEKIKNNLLQELQTSGLQKQYERLKERDPLSAQKIHPNDQYRILRALEVMEIKKQPLSQIRAEFVPAPFPYPVEKIGLRREKGRLKELIAERTRVMLQDGLIEEVQGLIKKYGPLVKPLSSVGYKEVCEFLRGEISSREELANLITTHTLQLAKRQSVWFKRDPAIQWIDPDKLDKTP